MKAFTNIEQSKELVKILPIKSADFHFSANISPQGYLEKPIWGNPEYVDYSALPCWSLSALLDLLPNQFNNCVKTLYWFNNTWNCDYMDEDAESEISRSANNPVDACVEMIFELKRLIDNNLL